MAGLAFPADGVAVIVGMTAYAGLRKTTIGMPPAGFRPGLYRGIRDILQCVTEPAFDAGMFSCPGETRC